MKRTAVTALLTLLVLALAGCGSGKPKQRINPPTVSVQELRFNDDGSCLLRIRIQNHSSVVMRYTSLQFDQFQVDGRDLAPLTTTPDLDVPPYTGEPFEHSVDCTGFTRDANELIYRIDGLANVNEPRERSFPFHFRSRLLPVPGLSGVYR